VRFLNIFKSKAKLNSTPKIYKKTTFVRNASTGNVCFSLEQGLQIQAGDVLEVYEPKRPKMLKNLIKTMTLSQTDVDCVKNSLYMSKNGEQFYLFNYVSSS